MSLIPTVYNSTDPGAPQLTGMVGSLTALLDAVLVDGYGVGADAKAPAGWSREFTAANVRVYRGNPITGSGYRLRIDDSALVGNARHAWACGYDAMSSVDVGVNSVPLKSDMPDGVLLPKSISLGSASRRWRVVATEIFVYLFIDTSGGGRFFPWYAGDPVSYKPGDLHCFVIADTTAAAWAGSSSYPRGLLRCPGSLVSNVTTANGGLFVARSHSGAAGSVRGAHFSHVTGLFYGGYGGSVYPNPVNSGLLHTPVCFSTGASLPRGELPGAIGALQSLSFPDGVPLVGIAGFESERIIPTNYSIQLATSPADFDYLGCLLLRLDTEWHK